MSISVESLTKVYGPQKAVDGISFSAAPGVLGRAGLRHDGGAAMIDLSVRIIHQS